MMLRAGLRYNPSRCWKQSVSLGGEAMVWQSTRISCRWRGGGVGRGARGCSACKKQQWPKAQSVALLEAKCIIGRRGHGLAKRQDFMEVEPGEVEWDVEHEVVVRARNRNCIWAGLRCDPMHRGSSVVKRLQACEPRLAVFIGYAESASTGEGCHYVMPLSGVFLLLSGKRWRWQTGRLDRRC